MTPAYVCGFLFSPDQRHVVLIRKTKPVWQAGSLNGVGGKMEPGESPREAMIREFKEETGIEIQDWTHFANVSGRDWGVYFFRAEHHWYGSVRTQEEEEIEIHAVEDLDKQILIPNLRWLIPMAIGDQSPWPYYIEEAYDYAHVIS